MDNKHDPLKKLTGVLEPVQHWESHELDAYVDWPERRRHPALNKADETSATPPLTSKPQKHSEQIRSVADAYAAKKGLKLDHNTPTLKVHTERAGKIAEAYHHMNHDPHHPEVKASYDALINETAEQFNHIMQHGGLKVSKIKPGMDNPYKSSKDLHEDLKNGHMWYYPTESGFGTEEAGSDHPMLRDTGHKDEEGKPLLANDMFRIVHDYFGHGKEGFGFGSAGEENAWAHHKQMYSPQAHAALTTETRGQNSWVNFGPHGENNRANPAQTIYAQQKAGILPDWAHDHSPYNPEAHKSETMAKSESQMTGNIFMAYDGDNAGRLVGRAILADDPQALHDVSNRIAHGHDIVKDWVEHHGGKVISGGGDEGTFFIPAQAIEDIEKLRADYQYATQLTMTVGVGSSLSEAGKALMVGKFRGKDQVCQYDSSIEAELKAAQDHVADGSATGEEKKLGEAYLTPDEKATPMKESELHDCAYCTELAQDNVVDEDHCQYCHGAEPSDAEPHCQYCAEAEQRQTQDHEHTGDDCQYCQAADAQVQDTHEHTGDDCEYCRAAEQAEIHDPNAPDHEADCQYCAEANAQAPMEQSDGPEDMPGTIMQDGVSHPENYSDQNAPSDMGLAEDQVPDENPDLSQVLQGGLDQHADTIAREKVVSMISEALEGFKACKPILERAQEQAPQLYSSSIAMLKAMIEMAKMLGLAPQEAQQEQTDQDSNPQDPQANPQPAAAPQEGEDDAGKLLG